MAEVRVELTEQLYSRATRHFVDRKFRKLLLFTLVLYALLLLLLWVVSRLCPGPVFDSPALNQLLVLVIVVTPGVCIVTPAATYWRTMQNCRAFLKKMGDTPVMTFGFEPEQVTVDSNIGSSNLKWPLFHELQRFDDLWLLFINPMGFYVLPKEQLDESTQALVLDKLSEHNIKVS